MIARNHTRLANPRIPQQALEIKRHAVLRQALGRAERLGRGDEVEGICVRDVADGRVGGFVTDLRVGDGEVRELRDGGGLRGGG